MWWQIARAESSASFTKRERLGNMTLPRPARQRVFRSPVTLGLNFSRDRPTWLEVNRRRVICVVYLSSMET
jgi:hypothetical protein